MKKSMFWDFSKHFIKKHDLYSLGKQSKASGPRMGIKLWHIIKMPITIPNKLSNRPKFVANLDEYGANSHFKCVSNVGAWAKYAQDESNLSYT